MKFVIDAARIVDAVAKIKSVLEAAGATEAHFFVMIKKNQLRLAGDGQVACANIELLDAKCSSADSSIAVDAEQMLGLIKGRGEMEFSMTEATTMLNMKTVKGRYNASMPTRSTSAEQLRALDVSQQGTGLKLSKELLTSLKMGLDLTAVKDVYQNNPLTSYISLIGGELNISCYDNVHFAHFQTKIKSKQEFRVAMPMTYFNAIYKMCGEDAEFDFGQSMLVVTSDNFSMRMPAIHSVDQNYELVQAVYESAGSKAFSAMCKYETLKKVCNNLFSMYETNSYYSVVGTETEIDFGIKSNRGSANDTLVAKGKGGAEFKVDPKLFQDMLSRVKHVDRLRLSVVLHKCLFMTFDIENDFRVILGCQLAAGVK